MASLKDPTVRPQRASKAGTCSEWAPDFQCCMQPLRVRGHRAVSQMGQVECGRAAPRVAFPNTFLSHDEQLLACRFCHLVVSMACLGSQWRCMWRACPVLFFSGQTQLHFLWPYQALCFQNCYSATWGLLRPYILPAENNEKNN